MSASKVCIGDFLTSIRRPVDIAEATEYTLVTVRLHHKGVVERCRKHGRDIGTKKMYEVRTGDFILSGIDARNGAFGIVPTELEGAVVTNDFWYFAVDEGVIDRRLFLELTSTDWFDDICRKGSDGTTQRIRLQKDKFFNQAISLPAKDAQPDLLDRVLTSRRVSHELTAERLAQRQTVADLRQAILQEAVQGELTADWREDYPDVESSRVLLERIQAEKAALAEAKKIRKQKPLRRIAVDDIPFNVPPTWEWARLGEITNEVTSGSRNWKSLYAPAGSSFIRSQDIKHDRLQYDRRVYVNVTGKEEGTRTAACEHDWLITITGGNVGRCAYLSEDPGEAYVSQHVALMRPTDHHVGPFGHLWLTAEFGGRGLLRESVYGDKPGLNLPQLRNLVMPVPPVAEQKEIVTRVRAVQILCDQIDAEIAASERYAEHLSTAILQEVFENGHSED